MTTTVDVNELATRGLALVTEAKNGHDVILMEGDKPIARIVLIPQLSAKEELERKLTYKPLRLGPKAPLPTRAELAEEMFDRK